MYQVRITLTLNGNIMGQSKFDFDTEFDAMTFLGRATFRHLERKTKLKMHSQIIKI